MDSYEVREILRLVGRFVVAVLLDILAGRCREQAGLDLETNNGHVALSLATEYNTFATLASFLVFLKIAIVPDTVEGVRRTREECDVILAIGFFYLLISLFFLAYLRWFVVG